MLARLLYLEPGQLRRAGPLFALYLVLFGVLSMADNLSLALVVGRLGAAALPRLQAGAAVCVMLAVAWYMARARHSNDERLFAGILLASAAVFAAACAGLHFPAIEQQMLGLVFVGRELAYALVLLHFGAYLQGFFTRQELNRVMPVIYAGGRLGGIAAGGLIGQVAGHVEPVQLLAAVPALFALAAVSLRIIPRLVPPLEEPPAERRANSDATSTLGFARQIGRTPLLLWITLSTVALVSCRSGLALQSSLCLQGAFADEASLARFLGRYSLVALAVSLPLQLLVVGRLVGRLGLGGAQFIYAILIAGVALAGWGEFSLAGAVAARFVESELRFALRNPLAQMTVNLFPKQLRTQARAWSLGVLIPATTLAASLCFALLVDWQASATIAALTIVLGLAYLASCLRLAGCIGRLQNGVQAWMPAQRPAAGPAGGLVQNVS